MGIQADRAKTSKIKARLRVYETTTATGRVYRELSERVLQLDDAEIFVSEEDLAMIEGARKCLSNVTSVTIAGKLFKHIPKIVGTLENAYNEDITQQVRSLMKRKFFKIVVDSTQVTLVININTSQTLQ